MPLFISSLKYKEHTIDVSQSEKKHIILTGKNGSGKTSLLKTIRNQLMDIENGFSGYSAQNNDYKTIQNIIEQLNSLGLLNENMPVQRKKSRKKHLDLVFNIDQELIQEKRLLHNGFVLAYFDSKRITSFEPPQGVTIPTDSNYSLKEKANTHFIQYLVNLKAERAFAYQEGNVDSVKSIDDWFKTLEENFRVLFETEHLELYFNRSDFSFSVKFDGKSMNLLRMSDGFSSIIYIVSEIIMRMKNKRRHKSEGIVIIDEIETHLHVSLQKKILVFLNSFFPNIQFVISTHSPFILSSLSNAVIYDMETKENVHDMSGFSYESIIENYFNTDQYSDQIKQRFEEYLSLIGSLESLNNTQINELKKLTTYIAQIPDHVAPELKYKFYESELFRKSEGK